ncbi:hypothetical protein GCM10007924_30820 [Sneathiella chinensis]|uniref:DUF484 family protein n=1 Tax=Sneathiella chinensis TaxID=349750 RepID=A0ABQ5U6T2_9PROT|nr:hypothetical protein GCM10007924_30820 [Sneathiella chinensis]
MDALSTPTEQEVRDWLSAHPDFLENNADLLAGLTPPSRVSGEGVVDMQSFLLDRLQREVKTLKSQLQAFVAAARQNAHTQSMVHAAVQTLLSATSFGHFVHILTQDLPEILEVDVMTLCVEDSPIPVPAMTGLQRLKNGSIGKANWQGRRIIMRADAPKSPAVFGAATDLVRSDARILLDIPSLHAPAMLAIGSRETGHFHEEQGTELLGFFAGCVQACLQSWAEHTAI